MLSFFVAAFACTSRHAPAPAPPYNLSKFEEEILPKWIAQYRLDNGVEGQFSFHPGSKVAHPYATSDVAHVLCFTDQLDTVVPTESVRALVTIMHNGLAQHTNLSACLLIFNTIIPSRTKTRGLRS